MNDYLSGNIIEKALFIHYNSTAVYRTVLMKNSVCDNCALIPKGKSLLSLAHHFIIYPTILKPCVIDSETLYNHSCIMT